MTHRTVQRSAIRSVFEESARPLGPAEVLEAAQQYVPHLGMTTVYRTLRSLVDEGWLDVVDLPGAPARYECAGAEPHAFFRCEECDRVYRAPGTCPGVIALVPEGFALTDHSIVLSGVCGDCRQAVKQAAQQQDVGARPDGSFDRHDQRAAQARPADPQRTSGAPPSARRF